MENNQLYSALQGNKPIKSYKKTILAKVCITVFNSLTNSVENIILHGDPRKNDDGAIWDIFSETEDSFFKRMNRVHFQNGTIIPIVREEVVEDYKEEQFSDEQLKALINEKYFGLVNKINGIDSEAVMYRMLNLAREMEKSEKVINLISGRLSEIQAAGLPKPMISIQEEV